MRAQLSFLGTSSFSPSLPPPDISTRTDFSSESESESDFSLNPKPQFFPVLTVLLTKFSRCRMHEGGEEGHGGGERRGGMTPAGHT
jgi:hypothetical protein